MMGQEVSHGISSWGSSSHQARDLLATTAEA
jgi:hypothetical protein